MKRGDTLRKIATLPREGRLESLVEAQQKDDGGPELDLYRPDDQDQIDLTGTGGTLPPVCPPVEARRTRICRASALPSARGNSSGCKWPGSALGLSMGSWPSFERYGRLYYLDPGDADYSVGDRVLVPTESGPEVAECVWAPELVEDDEFEGLPCAGVATPEHLERDAANRRRRAEAKLVAKRLIKRNELPMKVVAVDFIDSGIDFDQLVVIYFTAPHRVDFRALVSELARTPGAHRPAADRVARRRAARRRPRQLWTRSLLCHVPEGFRACQPTHGQGARSPAEPLEDLRRLRSADVLPEVRASAVYRVRADRAYGGRLPWRTGMAWWSGIRCPPTRWSFG